MDINYSITKIQRCKEYKNYDVCISCSLFKLNSKVEKKYRDFSKYVKDFETKMIPNIPKSAYIRMYVDESVLIDKDFMRLFDKHYENLEIILFEFKDFLNEDGTHDGTFGTIARLLSLYNLPEIHKNVKYVWISDIDLPSYIFSYDNIKDLKKYKAQVSYYSLACNNREWFPLTVKYPIGAGKIIVDRNVKFEIKDLERFLNDLLNNKYQSLKEKIIIKRKESYSHYIPAKYFTYGFDELFINTYFVKYFESIKQLIYLNLSLENFKKEFKYLDFSKIKKLENQIWKNKNYNTKENRLLLLNFNDEIYDLIKTQKINDFRLQMCLKDFENFHTKINLDLNTNWGLTSLIIE